MHETLFTGLWATENLTKLMRISSFVLLFIYFKSLGHTNNAKMVKARKQEGIEPLVLLVLRFI